MPTTTSWPGVPQLALDAERVGALLGQADAHGQEPTGRRADRRARCERRQARCQADAGSPAVDPADHREAGSSARRDQSGVDRGQQAPRTSAGRSRALERVGRRR